MAISNGDISVKLSKSFNVRLLTWKLILVKKTIENTF